MNPKTTSFESASSSNSGKLDAISWKVEPLTGKLPLAGRCHRLPRRLEHDYSLSSKVFGTGYNGKVHLARSRVNNKQPVAVKTFKMQGLSERQKERLMAETSVFLCMDHPHVARLMDVYESDNHISLVMECMDGGELFDRVTSVKYFTEPAAADATRQMLLALHYLHCRGMVHRDLKLENFLYDCQEGDHLKMIDFGFSKFHSPGRMKTSCGTLAYVAPEVLKRNYTSQCDLWSMGVIVFILLSGRMPFAGESEDQVADIKRGRYIFKVEYWSEISQAGIDFVKGLLEVDPNRRLTSKTALGHVWLEKSFAAATPQSDASILGALRSWVLAPKLHRACMSMMAWSLTNKHHSQVREHFLALDKNHDGAISLDELREALGGCGCDEQEVYQIFDLLSQGHEDKIHYSDFLAAMVCSHLEVDDRIVQVAFQKFDRHSSGFIAPQDLKTVLGSKFVGAEIDALIEEGDLNGDGKLDNNEFQKYVSSNRQHLIAAKEAVPATGKAGEPPAARVPVLLGNQRGPCAANAVVQKGPEKGVRFTEHAAAHQEVVIEVTSKQLPACCIVQ